ncbi:hypothetical protein CPB84DRAFT_284141 [Gymnopilus junonius]|uniref:Uncharacterized protein n=1 Tax=Gymnopilus junonius TaxID=109634 RepID=A0A9P5NF19_GYMJU|nr:hypothetical protein CPB84DRAFT_284141 [Gymnopilus junonius]
MIVAWAAKCHCHCPCHLQWLAVDKQPNTLAGARHVTSDALSDPEDPPRLLVFSAPMRHQSTAFPRPRRFPRPLFPPSLSRPPAHPAGSSLSSSFFYFSEFRNVYRLLLTPYSIIFTTTSAFSYVIYHCQPIPIPIPRPPTSHTTSSSNFFATTVIRHRPLMHSFVRQIRFVFSSML